MTVEEIKAYFQGLDLPQSVEIDTGVVIDDVPLFLQSHLDYLEANIGKKSADVYLDRILKLIKKMEENEA